MTLKDLSLFANDLKPILECIAFVVGAGALIKWFVERDDRATDVLLKLEEHFNEPQVRKGRQLVEDPQKYDSFAAALRATPQPEGLSDTYADLDELLRFYVVVFAVRQARQVPEQSLSTCYRFWLGHYYLNKRSDLRTYINSSFPTLRDWLLEDADRHRRRPGSLLRWWRPPFFTPAHFWKTREFELNPKILSPDRGNQ